MRQRVHVSWLIALGCFVFVVGVWLALFFELSGYWACGAVILLGLSVWWGRVYCLPFIVIGGMVGGLAYGGHARGDLHVYVPLLGQQITMKGRVREDPTTNDRHQIVLQFDSIVIADHSLPGSVWASVIGTPDVKRGDEVVVMGELEPGFGTFVGSLYTARIVTITRPSPGDIGRDVRDWFADGIRIAIPEPQASLGIGYLTGQKSALPGDLADALQIAGLSHIVVASGYNLTILVRLARRLFMRVSKFVATLGSSIMIASFVSITGLSPSMTRAGLVSGLSLAAWYYGRKFHPFVLLPFAAAITVIIQPSYVWGDLGWLLSFSAFAAVMIVSPLLQRFFFGDKRPGTIRQILGETVAAHIVTIPIIVFSFGVISHVAIPANLLIAPLVPLAMLLTFLSGIVGLALPGVAVTVSLPTTWLLTYMTSTAEYLADVPWAQSELIVEWWAGALYYVVLIALCVYMWKSTKFNLRNTNIVD